MVTPLLWHTRRPGRTRTTVWPLWYGGRDTTESDTSQFGVLFPLLWTRQGQQRGHAVFFPLVWSRRTPERETFLMPPLIAHRRDLPDSSSLTMVTPLFWHVSDPYRRRTTLFPLFGAYSDATARVRFNLCYFLLRYHRAGGLRSTSVLWPLVAAAHDTNYRSFRIFPLVWYKRQGAEGYTSLFPLFFSLRRSEYESFNLLLMLYNRRHTYGAVVTNGILWKLLYWERWENGDYAARFLYLLYANVKKQGRREFVLFPFVHRLYEPDGSELHAAAAYWYARVKRRIPNTEEFYREERIFWFIRLRSNYQSLKSRGIVQSRRDL